MGVEGDLSESDSFLKTLFSQLTKRREDTSCREKRPPASLRGSAPESREGRGAQHRARAGAVSRTGSVWFTRRHVHQSAVSCSVITNIHCALAMGQALCWVLTQIWSISQFQIYIYMYLSPTMFIHLSISFCIVFSIYTLKVLSCKSFDCSIFEDCSFHQYKIFLFFHLMIFHLEIYFMWD